MKIVTVYGTRPELIKLSEVIKKLDQSFEHILIDTGQNSDFHLNKIFLKDLKIRKPNYFLKIKKTNYSDIVSQIIKKIYPILKKEKPDAFLIYGDTNSCLSSLVAKNLKIPIFHMEAGNRCYDERVPEEINRKIIDHISDINIVLSEIARQNLIREGLHHKNIFKSGSHMHEILNKYKINIENSTVLKKFNLKKNKYFLVSFHRAETVDNKKEVNEIIETLKSISKKYSLPILVSTHPRTKNKLLKHKIIIKDKNIKFLKPFGFFEYINLQKNSYCVISDSGSLFEEASLLNFNAISLRNSHERYEGIEYSSIILSSIDKKNIIRSLKNIKANTYYEKPKDYLGGHVSKKIVQVILSNLNRLKLKKEIGY